MSLYNMLFGINDDAPILLGMIEMNMESFARFRDVFLIENGKKIKVYTRLGGGNRNEYKKEIESIRKNENYLKDYDDSFDCTYAYFEFKIPEKYIETAKKMFKKEPLTVDEMFKKEIKEMEIEGSEANKKAEKIADKILQEIDKGNHFISL